MPKRQYTVKALRMVRDQLEFKFSDLETAHIKSICRRLKDFEFDSEEVADLDIRPFEPFFEMRPVYSLFDKGGALGRKEVMVVFGTITRSDTLIVLGIYPKWHLPIEVGESIHAVFERYFVEGGLDSFVL